MSFQKMGTLTRESMAGCQDVPVQPEIMALKEASQSIWEVVN